MSSVFDICNKALSWAGAQATITSFNQPGIEAKSCQQFYNSSRQEMLQLFWWGFAKGQINLTLLDTAPVVTGQISIVPLTASQTAMLPWLYKYAYPSDAIQCRYLIPFCSTTFSPLYQYSYNQATAIAFEIGTDKDSLGNDTKVIYCNQPNAIMCYTRDISNTQLFDDQFEMALSHMLASYIVMPISGQVGIAQNERKIAMEAIAVAEQSTGNEGPTFQTQQCEWMNARGYGVWRGSPINGNPNNGFYGPYVNGWPY